MKRAKRTTAALLAVLTAACAALPGMAFAAETESAPEAVLAETTSTPSTTTTTTQTRGIIANTYTNFTVRVGESRQATLDRPIQAGTWVSADPTIAEVTPNGTITGKKMGQTILTVTSSTGETIRCTASVGFHVGIDISTHNNHSGKKGDPRKPVDWKLVKDQGVDFAIIRAAYGWENYPNQIDATFVGNVKGAVETGIPFGLYHFSYAETVEDARKEADYLLRAISDYIPQYADKITLPIAYDMETTKMQSLSGKQLTDIALAFCERIEQAGYRPMVYSITVLFKRMDLVEFRKHGYPIWYAYPDNESANFSVRRPVGATGLLSDVWQYTFRSKMAGTATAAGNTDVNVAYMHDCDVYTLSAPVIDGVEPSQGAVTVTWSASPNATRYNIFRYDSTGNGKVVGSTSALTFTDTSVTGGAAYTYRVQAVHNCDDVMARVLSAQSNPSAQVTPQVSTASLTLDTRSVRMIAGNSPYRFLVRGNGDTANLKAESADPNIATVTLEDGKDSRGAKYRIDAKSAGTTEIKVTYGEQTATLSVQVEKAGGSILLDTSRYVMAPGGQYTIGAFVRDAQGNRLSAAQMQDLVKTGKLVVRDSRTGSIVDLKQLPNGNFQVTGKKAGTCYILYEINGVHASVRVDVQDGLQKPYGSTVRSLTYWKAE